MYADILYGKIYKDSFHQDLEKIQNNLVLAIIEAIRGTSKKDFTKI